MRIERQRLVLLAYLLLAVGLTGWIYAPGLYGDFLFDDFANLPALGSSGPVIHWDTFLRYITSGMADPTGRPLTLLTFLLDGHDWPTDAYPFKRTNLILHLINGVLLTLLLVQLGKRLIFAESGRNLFRMKVAAGLAATLWMIHPLFVSTVLYVVQREAMLPMTCVLSGLLLWLRGRDALMRGQLLAGSIYSIAGLAGCSALGILSKANGALLPIYAVLIECLLLRAKPLLGASPLEEYSSRGTYIYKRIFILVGWLPTLAVFAYLIDIGITGAIHGIDRPWTISQRLLTEPRVLFEYLDLLWVPRPFTPGLFNDQIIPSLSLWSPPSTGLALAGVSGLLLSGWIMRHRYPVASFVIVFYFAGQLLESTTIPLELYYEHRNYIPAMFMFWPLALWLCETTRKKASSWERPKIVLAGVLILGLAAMTRVNADLWGNGTEQAVLWAKLNPTSARAQTNAANYEMMMGHAEAAQRRLISVLHEHPDDPQITLNILSAHCELGGVDGDDLNLAKNTLAHLQNGEQVIFHWLGNAIELAAARSCPGLTSDGVAAMLDAAERNPRLQHITGRMQDIYHLRGQLALSQHQPAEALIWFNKGLALRPDSQMAFEQAAQLGNAGYPAEGLNHLAFFESEPHVNPLTNFGMPRIHDWVLRRQHYWDKELIHLRTTLQDDLQRSRYPGLSKAT